MVGIFRRLYKKIKQYFKRDQYIIREVYSADTNKVDDNGGPYKVRIKK